jgi:dTMP kinase
MQFVTFEGIEGSGKSTQIKMSGKWLSNQGKAVHMTREPGGTPIGDQIREILLKNTNIAMTEETELLLYMACRAQHMRETIVPFLQTPGNIVLCDRFDDSTIAYQAWGRGIKRDLITPLNTFATEGRKPDLTILLDLPVEEGLRRARTRNAEAGIQGAMSRFDDETVQFHERVRNGFLALAREEAGRIRIVDANRAPDLVFADVQRVLEQAL